MSLEEIRSNFLEKIKTMENSEQMKNFRVSFLGKKSEINELMKGLRDYSIEQKREFGVKVNELRDFMAREIAKIEERICNERIEKELKSESLDVTLPARQSVEGLIHPVSRVQKEFRDILSSMGFADTNGSEIESDWNCFGGLNIPANHPARQMQDTFYLKNDENEQILLRTQTTSLHMRDMTDREPPFKYFTTGKTFRSEMDATHSPMFHQIDVIYVDEKQNMQNLKNCLITICKKFFGIKNVPLRFRPSYFPFTSPSVEVDIQYKKTDKKLILGDGEKWMEILGAGMLHPNVMRNAKLDPKKYQGFAFAFGIERMAMLKYGMNDIRSLYDGDMAFLRHYGFRVFE
ncbi:phenylalanine--tRNA ligase alpha subunit [Bacilli bacterium]|nr:phenylalanine--tRNA ligase alpha subunit [Bacilli bacterium]